MKKENIFSLVMYLLIFAFAVVYGLTVLQTHFQYSTMTQVWQYAIYIICCIIAGVLISSILFELGHVIGAKVGGYKIVKFTVLYFSIYLENGKYKFGFRKFDGLTGETLIVPNYQKKAKPNPFPYLSYGPIFNLAWFVATLVAFFIFDGGSKFDADVAYAFLTVGLLSAILFIYDIVPIKSDTTTNGYALFSLMKSKDIDSYNNLLLVKNAGDDVSLVEETKKAKEQVPQVNINTTEGKLLQVRNFIFDKKYDEASKLIEELLSEKDKLTSKTYLEAEEQRIYIKIMTTLYEEMEKYYEEMPLSLKRDISEEHTLVGIRTYILMAGLFDKSRSECLLVLKRVAKAYKNTPASLKHGELELFNDALEKVCSAHPKWELDIYKLYE